MILQRYTFGSKSQHSCLSYCVWPRCLWYCKDIHLEANHNNYIIFTCWDCVAYDIAKIYIWKQITTPLQWVWKFRPLLMILQRYTFGSKSQHLLGYGKYSNSCLWYCKDIHLEANHNAIWVYQKCYKVAYDIAKIYIWKQITTALMAQAKAAALLMILQRYTFGSKSQHVRLTR